MALAATDLIMPAGIKTQQDKLIELGYLGDALEAQINRAKQIADRFDHGLANAETAEERAVLTAQRNEAESAMFDLEEDLQVIDNTLDAVGRSIKQVVAPCDD